MRAPATSDPVLALNSNASPWGLWTVPVDGGEPELFFERPGFGATRPDCGDPPRTRLFYPSWYPEGDAVAVTDYATHEILRVDVSSGEAISLTDPAVVWAGMCSVSPDSEWGNPIAFAGQPPDEEYGVADNVLWILRPESPPVTLDSLHGRTPAWSPTDDYLAFSSVRRRPAPACTLHPKTLPPGASGVFVQHVAGDGGIPRRAVGVTPFDVGAVHPKWSPDGEVLVCMAADVDGPRRGLALIDLRV
jgi:Tol biopolymer transport system component